MLIIYFSRLQSFSNMFCVIMCMLPGAENCVVTTTPACTRRQMRRHIASSCAGTGSVVWRFTRVHKDCKDRMGACLNSELGFRELFYEKRFCEAMQYFDGRDGRVNCLSDGLWRPRCSVEDFNGLKQLACGSNTCHLSIVTQMVCLLIYTLYNVT